MSGLENLPSGSEFDRENKFKQEPEATFDLIIQNPITVADYPLIELTIIMEKLDWKRMGLRLNGGSVYMCRKCPKVLRTQLQYYKHNKMIHPRQKILCESCGKYFKYKTLYLKHLQQEHPELAKSDLVAKKKTYTLIKRNEKTNMFHCDMCEETFNTRDKILTHKDYKHKSEHERRYKCGSCARSYDRKQNLERHSRSAHGETTKADGEEQSECMCYFCGKIFKGESALQRHVDNSHEENGEEKAYKCDKCGKAFNRKMALKRHAIAHQEKSFPCQVCQQSFHYESSLLQHLDLKHDMGDEKKRTHQCQLCPKSYVFKSSICLHIRYEHTERKQKAFRIKYESNKTPQGYACHQCDKFFKNINRLQYHRDHNHDDDSRKYKCTVCPKSFHLKQNFKQHQSHHEDKEAACKVCGKVFRYKKLIALHLEHKHDICEIEKKFQCDKCGKHFAYKRNMYVHFIEAHNFGNANQIRTARKVKLPSQNKTARIRKIKQRSRRNLRLVTNDRIMPYNCNECERTFISKDGLFSHQDFEHQKEGRTYKCSKCERSFNIEGNLERHFKSKHEVNGSFKKPKTKKVVEDFSCNVCGIEYFTAQGRDQHEDFMHSSSEAPKRFHCAICQRGFAFLTNFKRHMKSCLSKGCEPKVETTTRRSDRFSIS